MTTTTAVFHDIDEAVEQSHQASLVWADSCASQRAGLLRALATALEDNAEELVALANEESGLEAGRLNGELARTAYQLRGFAQEVDLGVPYRQTDDRAVEGAPPAGRPRLTRVLVPLGPIAMFSASNFPFAFSVLGGDTASALAAGCTVIVKAHSGHPALSRRVFEVASSAIEAQGLPPGVMTLVEGASREASHHLVRHPLVEAVAFTGSYQGGVALWKAANDRPRPIPFYGELGSINPFVVLPAAARSGAELANSLAASITLGCGQFCTSPGLIIVFADSDGETLVKALAGALRPIATHRMLTETMRAGFDRAVEHIAGHTGVHSRIDDTQPKGDGPAPRLFEVDAQRFVDSRGLHEEMFGPSALVVKVKSATDVIRVLESVQGTLTTTLLGATEDTAENRALIRAAEKISGRVLFDGFPTGVAVTHAQQHGGPWPASTQPQRTSVGYTAIERFLRPVALQDAPDWVVLAKKGGAQS
jgi:acyl-CoA reductase-like NAD-dependent aldehyde dehydrogenase